MVLILAFKLLNVAAILLFVYKILAQSKKPHILDAITAILGQIQNPIKFKPTSNPAKFKNQNYPDSIYTSINNYLAQNLNFAGL